MMNPLIGTTMGKYQIVEFLGRGATADVYRAYQPALDRHVAIKVLHPSLATDKDFLGRFRREARAVAALRHPRIMQVYDFDMADGRYYMVTEFIDGHTLEARLQEAAANDEIVPLDEAIRITREIASALSYAHGHGMVHRDIKPANVMINRENQVILADFGMAKILSSAKHTATGSIIGTPYYMSPEQASGESGDTRSDLYSLGVMFFQMVTGQLPYNADTAVAVLLMHVNSPIPAPGRVNPSLPPIIDRIVSKAMAKKPDERYQTTTELVKELDRVNVGDSIIRAAVIAPSVSPPLPLSPVAALSTTDLLTPYTLSHGHVAANPAELPAVCDADWDRAVDHFASGYITRWLRDGANGLRAAHQHGPADELELIAARAEAISQQARDGSSIARNAGLEEFLEFLGATLPVADVTPRELNLAAVGVGEAGQPVALTITNEGRGYFSGDIVCGVPWLKVTPKQFGCAAGKRCKVTVKPNLHNLPAGRTRSAHALQIRSTSGNQFLAAQVDVLSSVLQVDVSTLDFGTVGQGETSQATLILRNGGQGYLTGMIHCRAPWLTVSPERFSVLAGDSIQVTVKALSHTLPPGKVTRDRALVIESNDGQAGLSAQIRVLSPHLKVEPAQVDMGSIDLVQPKAQKSVELAVCNTGHGILIAEAATDADWLNIEPAVLRCEAGEVQQLRLSTATLRTGDYHQTLRVASNAGTTEVPLLLRVHFSLEPETVHIPAGEFLRGSKERDRTASPSEKPQCRIYLTEYWIGKHPVTNAQYAVFVEATGRRPPEHWKEDRPPEEKKDHPVVNASWWDAMTYCRWLAEITGKPYRLPTEAQWEKAARGTDGRVYPWGNRWSGHKCNTKAGGKRGATPVGVYSPAGDSPYGCADMAGNVLEWVSDWYNKGYYSHSSVSENPYGPASGVVKVLRGGAWSSSASEARSASRAYGDRKLTSPGIGFRCALAPKASSASSSS